MSESNNKPNELTPAQTEEIKLMLEAVRGDVRQLVGTVRSGVGQLANMVDNLGTQIDNLRDKFKEVDRLVDSNDGRFDRLHLAVHSVSSERPLATCLSPGRPPNISLAEHSVSTADVHGIIISV